MIEMLVYTMTGVCLYVLSDWILERLEASAERRFEQRSLLFFAILLGLSLLSFWLIRTYLPSP